MDWSSVPEGLQRETEEGRSRDERKQKGRSGPVQCMWWGMMGQSWSHSVKRPRVEEAEKARFLGITVPAVLMLRPS